MDTEATMTRQYLDMSERCRKFGRDRAASVWMGRAVALDSERLNEALLAWRDRNVYRWDNDQWRHARARHHRIVFMLAEHADNMQEV